MERHLPGNLRQDGQDLVEAADRDIQSLAELKNFILPWKWWRDVARQIFKAPAEQYFIRLSSDQPFERLADDPGFREVIAALGKLGLAAVPERSED